MLRNRFRALSLLLLGGSACILSSCGSSSSQSKHFPSDAGDNIVGGITGKDDIFYNDFEDFYDSISSGTAIEAKALNDILYNIAKQKLSIDEGQLTKRIEEAMIKEVNGGTYDTDYRFDEMRYVLSLRSSMYRITCGASNADAKKDLLITPDLAYADIFGCDYSDYIERNIKPTILRRMLVAQYIYDDSYSSIGNTYARDVKIVKLTDRSDAKGSVVKTIKAFIDKYISDPQVSAADRDLDHLAKLWLGGSGLSESDKQFIESNNLTTLDMQITEEVKKITLDNESTTDKSMESKYTNSYTYSVEKGEQLAHDSLSRTDLITEGYFLKSSGLSDLPAAIKNRVFSTNYNLSATPENPGKDVTTFVNGVRYLTPAKIENRDDIYDSLVHYDAATSSYYLIEIRDVITTAALEKKDSDSDEVKAAKTERALKVAYELATTSTYVTDSTVYWLKKSDIVYSDKDFYEYIKSTYPDVFEED